MTEVSKKTSYDVLRLIEHGKSCYISSENVEGKTLVKYLKYHPALEKSELYEILREITRQLELIHRCRGNPCYQYVNPYSMIRADDGRIYYLDMKSEDGKEHIRFMQRRDIREYFLPSDEKYYQHASMELDIYGLGRTFQYILASTEPEPHLSRREEICLKKIISKALGNQSSNYSSISDIQKQIPTYKEKEKRQNSSRKRKSLKKLCIIGSLVLLAGGYLFWQTLERRKSVQVSKVLVEKTDQKTGKNAGKGIGGAGRSTGNNNPDQAYIELAMAYFLDVGDADKSMKYLKKMKDSKIAENLGILIASYKEHEMTVSGTRYQKGMQELENWLADNKPEKKELQVKYLRCLIRGYGLMNGKKGADEVLRLVNKEQGNNGMANKHLDKEAEKELRKYEAAAYEKKGEREKAAEVYTDLLQLEPDSKLREQLYKKMVLLYEKSGRKDMAGEICRQGMNELKESEELKLLHIRILCADTSISREECAQVIKGYLTEYPGLSETEEFKKLQKEYEIRREGEEVWVGR